MSDLQSVLDNLDDQAADRGWDESEITRRLDLGQSVNRISAAYWRMRANATIELVNTSESGSSRGLDSVYPRMVAIAEKFEKLADAEDAVIAVPAAERVDSIPVRRV